MPGNILILDNLVRQLSAFELSNFDNSMVTIGNYFESSLTIGMSNKEKKSKEESESESKDELDEL